MTRFKSISLLLAAALLSVAMVACTSDDNGANGANGDSDAGDDPVATAPSTSTPDGDTPVSSDDTPTGTPDRTPDVADHDRVVVDAPIEEVEVLFLESFPVQHRLRVVSGLPSGCANFDGIEVVRDGTTFTVTVTNTMPAPDQDMACTMIYGYHESTVDLGNDLESGTEYTVQVNDQVITFVAQ